MPVKLKGEQKIVLALGALLLLIAGIAAVVTPDQEVQDGPLSTYSSHSTGAKAVFFYVGELGYATERFDQSPLQLPQESNKVLYIIGHPLRNPTLDEKESIHGFLDRGGTVLAAGTTAGMFIPHSHEKFEIGSFSWLTSKAAAPHPLNAGVPAITAPLAASWNCEKDEEPLFTAPSDASRFERTKVVAVTYRVGKGRVIWLGAHAPLSNAGLKAAGNAEFLSNVLASTETQRVLWDTYYTEDPAGKSSSLTSAPVLAAAAQLLLIFGFVVMTYSRRFGPIRQTEMSPPMAQSEFVKTLGSLYRHAEANDIAVEIAYRRFVFLAARRLGLPGSVQAVQLSEAVARATSRTASSINSVLTRCESARYKERLSEKDAFELMNALHQYMIELKLIPDEQRGNAR